MLVEALVVGTMVISSSAAHLLNKRDNVKQADVPKEDRVMFYTANEAKEKVVEKCKDIKDNVKNKTQKPSKEKDEKEEDVTKTASTTVKEDLTSSDTSTEEAKPPKFTVVDDNNNETK